MLRALAILLAMTALTSAPASALEGELVDYLGLGRVFVWNDEKALKEGVSLIMANALQRNPGLIVPLIACLPEPGTHVLITDAGFGHHSVVVMDGDFSGCRGVIQREAFTE